ncbi:MAG: tetratricopeptide repeat protein [Muribaculaceae bacterium]|nr:tetratricopeptide repeat protein [Muribaculaceae bacterium]
MMKMLDIKIWFLSLVVMLGTLSVSASTAGDDTPTVKKERNFIRKGNKLYNDKRYAEAEVEYRKALQVAPQSSIAQFNLATALMRQGSATASQDSKDNPMNEAQALLENLVKTSPSRDLRGKASYDLGNIAYAQQKWQEAIDCYKNALRCNPNDDHARENLRLAQLKKQQQDKQNKDNKNNKNNQDKNKDQNQDQQDKNKDQKDQNKDQQDQDQNKQDKKNQDQQNQQPQNQQNGQPKQQNGMSQQNVEQVLKAMQDQERATQQRINARQAQQQRNERARTNRKW